jgi:hypothetical protein
MTTEIITQELLENSVDFVGAQNRVRTVLANLDSPEKLLRFMREYAKWNSYFAGGVAQLVANISQAEDLFTEKGLPQALADRSQFIASFIFDAARDEFDDHINRERDPHRSLAQALLYGIAKQHDLMRVLNESEPEWLLEHCGEVVLSYDGWQGELFDSIFYGLGFHLGSELLADQEFTIIDEFMRTRQTETFEYLKRNSVHLADSDHRDYAWIAVHSGYTGGGAAEADHFAWALEGVNKAFEYLPATIPTEQALGLLMQGFHDFNEHHQKFFASVIE